VSELQHDHKYETKEQNQKTSKKESKYYTGYDDDYINHQLTGGSPISIINEPPLTIYLAV
jgi:hypothetical protein